MDRCSPLLALLRHLRRFAGDLYCVDYTLLSLVLPRDLVAEVDRRFPTSIYCVASGVCVRVDGWDRQPRFVDDRVIVYRCARIEEIAALIAEKCNNTNTTSS